MPALFSNEERQKKLLLTKSDMGSIYMTLTVRADDNRYVFNGYEGFQGMRVGVLKSGEDTRQFILWAREHQLKVELVEKEMMEDLTNALRQGDIDGIGVTYLGSDDHYKVVAEYSPMPLYFGISKKRPELLPQLEKALGQIAIVNPNFAVNLTQKYFSTGNGQKPVFTKAEQEFIAAGEPVLVALPDHNRPFSYLDQEGKLKGALPDLLEHLSELSGLKLQPVAAPSKDAALNMVKNGTAQVIGMILDDYSMANSSQLFLTSPIYKQTMAQVTLRGTTNIKKIGYSFGDVSYVLNNLPRGMGQTLPPHIIYKSNRECFQALADHQIDAVDVKEQIQRDHQQHHRVARRIAERAAHHAQHRADHNRHNRRADAAHRRRHPEVILERRVKLRDDGQHRQRRQDHAEQAGHAARHARHAIAVEHRHVADHRPRQAAADAG